MILGNGTGGAGRGGEGRGGAGQWLRGVSIDHSQVKQVRKVVSQHDEGICKNS